jgi:hypothetical protein
MRFPQQYVQQAGYPSAAVTYSGTAGTLVAPTTGVDSGLVGLFLAGLAVVSITTSGLTVSFTWQVLVGSTWVSVVSASNSVVGVTGTGTLASTSIYVPAPEGIVAGSRSVRLASTTAVHGGGGAGVDSYTVSYDFRAPTTSLGV